MARVATPDEVDGVVDDGKQLKVLDHEDEEVHLVDSGWMPTWKAENDGSKTRIHVLSANKGSSGMRDFLEQCEEATPNEFEVTDENTFLLSFSGVGQSFKVHDTSRIRETAEMLWSARDVVGHGQGIKEQPANTHLRLVVDTNASVPTREPHIYQAFFTEFPEGLENDEDTQDKICVVDE